MCASLWNKHRITFLHSFYILAPAVLKFKRRTRFLGFYVQVLAKALQEGLTETALDWTNDTMTWIIRLVIALNLYRVKVNFSLGKWNDVSEKCFSHTPLGPGYGSCDLWGGQLFRLRPPWPTLYSTSIITNLELFSLFPVFRVILFCISFDLTKIKKLKQFITLFCYSATCGLGFFISFMI